MIFITAGTTNFPFHRLERLVLSLCKLYPNKKFIFQISEVKEIFPEFVEIVSFLKPADFDNYLRTAEMVVSHAGYASVMKALRYAKTKPIVMPRLKRYGEHVNDHQLYFARLMHKKGLISLVREKGSVNQVISNNKYEPVKVKNYLKEVDTRRASLTKYLISITR